MLLILVRHHVLGSANIFTSRRKVGHCDVTHQLFSCTARIVGATECSNSRSVIRIKIISCAREVYASANASNYVLTRVRLQKSFSPILYLHPCSPKEIVLRSERLGISVSPTQPHHDDRCSREARNLQDHIPDTRNAEIQIKLSLELSLLEHGEVATECSIAEPIGF